MMHADLSAERSFYFRCLSPQGNQPRPDWFRATHNHFVLNYVFLLSPLTIHPSPFPLKHLPLTVQISRFRFHLSRFNHSSFTAQGSPFTAHHSPLTAHDSFLTIHVSQSPSQSFTAHRSPLTAHRSPLTLHVSRFTSHVLIPSANSSLGFSRLP